jgi:multidrug efflux system outer membrane protein
VEYRRQHQPPIEKDKEPLLDQYFVSGFDATWEADLFGRVRSLTTAARADVEAEKAACDDLAITIAAEVARNYFELRGQQQSLEANRRSVKWRAIELDLIRRRAAMGVANQMDIDNARRNFDRQRAEGNDLEAAIVRTVQALGVLTAQPAGALKPLLAVPVTPDHEPATPALGTPAELLRSRPDIREAEEELVSSSAVKDASKADLLPRLTFSGQLSFFAFGWGLGPDLTWDVFNRRRVKAREVRAGARADASFARYQLAVLTAVADVENALANLKAARGRRDALKAVSEDSIRLADAMKRRAALGVANKFDEAAAEQTSGDAAGALAAQEAAVNEAWVAVFKALGGGWRAPTGNLSPAPTGARPAPSQDSSLPPQKS